MADVNHAPCCGIYCGDCPFLDLQCQGCGYVNGKPFWTDQLPGRVCPLYECCRNHKQLEHCGLCTEFPCRVFLELRDPNMSDEAFQQALNERQKSLKLRAEIGTDAWLARRGTL
jgi:hypothetical protein